MAFKLRITWILIALLCGLAAMADGSGGATGDPDNHNLQSTFINSHR